MAKSQHTRVCTDRAAQNDLFSLLEEAQQILSAVDLAIDTFCRAGKIDPERRRISEHLVEALADLTDRTRNDLETSEDRHAA